MTIKHKCTVCNEWKDINSVHYHNKEEWAFGINWTPKPQKPAVEVTELEEKTADTWLVQGTIWITDTGSENTYYTDEFDKQYFCKNYPSPEYCECGLLSGHGSVCRSGTY